MPAPFLLLWHPRVQALTDAAEVYLDLQVITTDETAQYSDDATIYIDIQPGSIALDVPGVLEIVNCVSRWAIDASLGTRYALGSAVARMSVVANILRWAIMETRRFTWKA